MACLANASWDNTGAAATTKSCSTLIALTAIDTTNLRCTFTVPASGKVYVRMGAHMSGGSATPFFAGILLGILEGSTVIARQTPMYGTGTVGAATTFCKCEAGFVVSGLTPGASKTWDMAYGVEVTATGCVLKIGGPNNTTTNDAAGAAFMDVWDA
jgi:hypothetical protein